MGFLIKWKWEILSPFAGVLLTLAFAPYYYSVFALGSLIFVFLSWLEVGIFRVVLRGYLYGLGLFGSGISWVYISIHDYGGAPVVGAVLLTVLLVMFWALFTALTAYVSVKLAAVTDKQKAVWVLPFVWILVEYFRGYWVLNGFPWLQIGYSQLGMPLQGFVPIIGVYGTGFMLAMTATLLIAVYKKYFKYYYLLPVVFLLWGGGAILQKIQWTEQIDDELSIALIQGNISQDQKWLSQNRMKTLVDYRQLTRQNWDADVIIWPETAIPAFLSQVKAFYLDPLSEEAEQQKTSLVVSLPVRGENNAFYNTVLTLGNDLGRYDKNHLLPFGEYLPLQPLSGFVLDLLGMQLGNFTSGGEDQQLLRAGGYPFATSICYEDAFASEAIRTMPDATYLVNVTNDGWFGDSIEPHQHMQIAQMRALETGRYLLRATNTGVTAIVAPNGEIVSQAPQFKQTVLRGRIWPMKGVTVFSRIGDHITILLLVICLFVILSVRSRGIN